MRWFASAVLVAFLSFANSSAFAEDSGPSSDCVRDAVVTGCSVIGSILGRRAGSKGETAGAAAGAYVGGHVYDYIHGGSGSNPSPPPEENARPPADQDNGTPDEQGSEPSNGQDAGPQPDQPQ
jgi:hypothetical protein